MKIDVENPQAVLEDILTRINNGEYVKVVYCEDCRFNCGDACLHALGLAGIELPKCYCAYGKRRKEKPDGKTN